MGKEQNTPLTGEDKDTLLEEDTFLTEEEDDVSLVVTLKNPYHFEGKEYTEIDLTTLESLTTNDMIAAERHYSRHTAISAMPELSFEYSMELAARATKLPVEFFFGLPPREGMKVKNRVASFLFGED